MNPEEKKELQTKKLNPKPLGVGPGESNKRVLASQNLVSQKASKRAFSKRHVNGSMHCYGYSESKEEGVHSSKEGKVLSTKVVYQKNPNDFSKKLTKKLKNLTKYTSRAKFRKDKFSELDRRSGQYSRKFGC